MVISNERQNPIRHMLLTPCNDLDFVKNVARIWRDLHRYTGWNITRVTINH